MMLRFFGFVSIMGVALGALNGCGDDAGDDGAGSGTATFSVWGEEFIEDGIPADEFADGWSVTFDRFLLALGGITVRDRAGNGAELEGSWLLDLTEPGPHELGSLELTSKAWPLVGYAVRPVTAATELHTSATAGDLELMETGGFSVFVSGSAVLDGATKTFAWGFANGTRYGNCVSEIDGKQIPGILVGNGGEEKVELTIHGDHFFYDDLASEDAVPRFSALASADADDDGEVTLAELAAVPLVTLEDGPYGTGSASHVNDLGAFVGALTRTLGHFQGEGHCAEAAD